MAKDEELSGCVKFNEVYSREIDAINERRRHLRRPEIKLPVQKEVVRTAVHGWTSWFKHKKSVEAKPIYRKSSDAGLVGVALSGGGIRSASFCLGAVQALEFHQVLPRIDLLSTVSGGGYSGTSMTVAMTSGGGKFPFPSRIGSDEPRCLKHVRDHSNFLIPDGIADVLASAVIYLRGIAMNIVLLLPWLLVFAAVTIILNPTQAELSKPGPVTNWLLFSWLPEGLLDKNQRTYFTITIALFVFLSTLLLLWGGVSRLTESVRGYAETGSLWTKAVGYVFVALGLFAFFEAQPYVLKLMSGNSLGGTIIANLERALVGLAAIGTGLGFFGRTFESWIKTSAQDSRLRKWFLALAGKAGIYLAALVVPLVLWLAYIWLSYRGIALAPGGTETNPPLWLQNLANNVFAKIGGVGTFFKVLAHDNTIAAFYLFSAILLFVFARLLDPNKNSLHRLYRDRISKAFLFDLSAQRTMEVTNSFWEKARTVGIVSAIRERLAGKRLSLDVPGNDRLKLSQLSVTDCPYQIINAALNIQNSRYVNRRGRNADFFLFSPRFIGSVATGYCKTDDMEKIDKDLDVATAMAVSGAAFSSNMGSNTVRPMTPTLTALNIRLGLWLRNPNWRAMRLKFVGRVINGLNLYFLVEMFGLLREDSWRVYLTDGGHIDNLGIYELLKRKCRLIIVVDAEADPRMTFPSFVKLQRHARIDLGITIDLPWRRLQAVTLETGKIIAESGGPVHAETRKVPHSVVGLIHYGKGFGYLVYVKSTLTGDENDYILDYKRRYDLFPHETTGDQFFSEEQFEVYRALGFHAMSGFLKGTEEVPTFWDRRKEKGPTPSLYGRSAVPESAHAIAAIRRLMGLPVKGRQIGRRSKSRRKSSIDLQT